MEYEILLLNITRNIDVNSGFLDCVGQHSIASYIEKKGFKGKVYSGNIKNIKEIIMVEVQKRHVKIIGFYTAADNKQVVINILKWIKEKFDIVTVVGGPEAIGLDNYFFNITGCDYAIIGEGEEAISRLLSYVIDGTGNKENIESLVYMGENGDIIKNPLAVPIENLDSIPFPKIENSLNKNFRKSEMVGIITGRGCPFNCSFCYEGANSKKIRFRSIENVMQEIDYIAENNPNLKFINVYDDTFTLDFKRVKFFCDEIRKRNIKWFCEGHVTNIINNEEMIYYMVDSGLVSMQLGIESGSEKVLKAYNKKTTPDMIIEAVKICKKAGIPCVSGNFIVGGAYETEETVKESINLAKKLLEVGRGIFDCRTVFLSPYVNTRIALSPDNFDLKINKNKLEYQLTSMKSAVVETKTLSSERIEELKFEFDRIIKQEYIKQTKNSSKEDIILSCFYKGKRLKLDNSWHYYYRQIEHINNFILFYNSNDDIVDYKKYAVRTMETFYSMNLSADEYDVLKQANGKNTVSEIIKRLNWDKKKFENIYNILRNKCMIYLSEF